MEEVICPCQTEHQNGIFKGIDLIKIILIYPIFLDN